MDGMNIQELMSQAKKQYEVLQNKLQQTVVEGSSGGGRRRPPVRSSSLHC